MQYLKISAFVAALLAGCAHRPSALVVSPPITDILDAARAFDSLREQAGSDALLRSAKSDGRAIASVDELEREYQTSYVACVALCKKLTTNLGKMRSDAERQRGIIAGIGVVLSLTMSVVTAAVNSDDNANEGLVAGLAVGSGGAAAATGLISAFIRPSEGEIADANDQAAAISAALTDATEAVIDAAKDPAKLPEAIPPVLRMSALCQRQE